MKSEKKSNTIKEPTLGKVLAVMNERFSFVEKRIDMRAISTNERIDSIDARLGVLQRGQAKIENTIGDIQDDLASALHAADNDGSAILNHEHRIKHLEKIGGVKSVPPKHLAGLE